MLSDPKWIKLPDHSSFRQAGIWQGIMLCLRWDLKLCAYITPICSLRFEEDLATIQMGYKQTKKTNQVLLFSSEGMCNLRYGSFKIRFTRNAGIWQKLLF